MTAGIEAAQQGQWQQALNELKEALRLEAQLRGDKLLSAKEAVARDLLNEVMPSLLEEASAKKIAALLDQARKELRQKKFLEAVTLVDKAMGLKPRQPQKALALLKSICTLGAVKAIKDGKREYALLLIDRYLAWDEEDVEARRWKSSVMKALTKANKAANQPATPQIRYVPILVPGGKPPPPPPPPRRRP